MVKYLTHLVPSDSTRSSQMRIHNEQSIRLPFSILSMKSEVPLRDLGKLMSPVRHDDRSLSLQIPSPAAPPIRVNDRAMPAVLPLAPQDHPLMAPMPLEIHSHIDVLYCLWRSRSCQPGQTWEQILSKPDQQSFGQVIPKSVLSKLFPPETKHPTCRLLSKKDGVSFSVTMQLTPEHRESGLALLGQVHIIPAPMVMHRIKSQPPPQPTAIRQPRARRHVEPLPENLAEDSEPNARRSRRGVRYASSDSEDEVAPRTRARAASYLNS